MKVHTIFYMLHLAKALSSQAHKGLVLESVGIY
jgi:hypothetical protein